MILRNPPPSPVVGDRAPDVAFRRPDGSTLRLASFRGRVVVLEFTMLACPPCRALAPRLEAMAAKHPGVVFLTVCVDTPEATAELLRLRPKDARTTFAEDLRQPDPSRMAEWRFGDLGYPNLFVIGADGRLASRSMMEDLERLVPHLERRIAWAKAHPGRSPGTPGSRVSG